MNSNMFYILNGNNGATYILNLSTADSIKLSLNFYKARSLKQKVMKNTLKVYLYGLRLLSSVMTVSTLKTKEEIAIYLEKETSQTIDFGVDANSSLLISPTRDKVIVHHHGASFHKFAFGKSYNNVKNEAKIYKLLDKPLEHFKVSTFYDLEDNAQKTFCSFKLGYAKVSSSHNVDLTAALIEMFSVTKQEGYSWGAHLERLKEESQESSFIHEAIDRAFGQLETITDDVVIPLGLVHRDFKPWNINDEDGLLIYDFEEAVVDGPPLEDLFNFHIDPVINYISSEEVIALVLKKSHTKEYTRYLEKLNIDLDFRLFLYSYIIEKIVFYTTIKAYEVRDKYIELLLCLIKKES